MLFCQHRVNSPNDLDTLPTQFGVEIDLRSSLDDIYLAHDPFAVGPRFNEWLDHYQHSFIVLNVKEEGIENRIISMLADRGITQWAFLDQSFPFLVKGLKNGQTKTMVRVSEFESIETAVQLSPKPEWVWLDSFNGTAKTPDELKQLADAGYKFMIVSPELQGREPEAEISSIKSVFASAELKIDGVCSKQPRLWLT